MSTHGGAPAVAIGVCGELAHAAAARAAGYDYLEVPLDSLADRLAGAAALPGAERDVLGPAASMGVYPAAMPLVGPAAVDGGTLRRRAEYAVDVVRRSGLSRMVFAAGATRRRPPGWPVIRGYQQFADAVAAVAQPARRAGVTVGIEPLGAERTNLLTSLAETRRFLDTYCPEPVGVVVDLHHLFRDGEPVSDLEPLARDVVEVHVPAQVDGALLRDVLSRLDGQAWGRRVTVEEPWDELEGDLVGARERLAGSLGGLGGAR